MTEPREDKTRRQKTVVIIGSGIMGAAVARGVREAHPHAEIVMVSGGPRIGSIPGQHLHDSPDPDIRRAFNSRASMNQQNLYTGVPTSNSRSKSAAANLAPGMTSIQAIGDTGNTFPGAAIAWNEGGMSVHWAGGAPSPSGDEIPAFLDPSEWETDLQSAKRVLGVRTDAFELDAVAHGVLGTLNAIVSAAGTSGTAGRPAQPMPMAIERMPDGSLARTGPSRIFEAIASSSDERFTLVPNAICTRIETRQGRATEVLLRDIPSGRQHSIVADVVVVAADALRTPQLLFASGIRPEALGRYLNEHAFVSGSVTLAPGAVATQSDEIPAPGTEEPFLYALWLPYDGTRQPFHCGVLSRSHIADDGTTAYLLTLSWYVPTMLRRDNRVTFSESELDAAGLPRINIRFAYDDADHVRIAAACESQSSFAKALVGPRGGYHAAILPPGSSLHYTGTVRMGPTDDGSSVCDSEGRVWGYENVYVVGNGVVPTAIACNSTLTALTLALRATRAINKDLTPWR